VERYRARALMMRSENIARTEAVRSTSLAQEEALQQMIEQTGIDSRRVEDVWNATRDKRTRDWHESMDGQRRPHGVPFEDGHGNRLRFPGDPEAAAETTINCRCARTFAIGPPL
jgi:Phage Mu protein F like protein